MTDVTREDVRMSVADELIEKADSRKALFGVIGLGYVGLPLAVELGRAGFGVLGFDVVHGVVDGLMAGRSHVKDASPAQLAAIRKADRFTATTAGPRLKEADAISLCVPTPLS